MTAMGPGRSFGGLGRNVRFPPRHRCPVLARCRQGRAVRPNVRDGWKADL